MAVEKRKDNTVALLSESQAPAKKPKIVLDEDTYTEKIEKIIERDFFPDLSNLSVQKSYFDALERNDLVKLRELQMKYGGQCPTTGRHSSMYDSPATFETPQPGSKDAGSSSHAAPIASHSAHVISHDAQDTPSLKNNAESTKEDKEDKEGLDRFLAKHTSEDNMSFMEILDDHERQRRQRHAWLFDKEGVQDQEHERKLALPSMEDQAAITQRPLNVDTWTYKPDNTVMYFPKGEELSAQELIEAKKFKPRQVVHNNTRFANNPFGATGKEMLQKAAFNKALVNQGKIGHDGRELLAAHTPQVNGFSIVGEPSPAPGVDESPLMTWGEIEGTPLRLDGAESLPLMRCPGPVFKIPELPKRDRLGLALAEKNSKAHRAKKEAALKQVTRRLSSPSSGMSPLERLNSMSPAAQQLASKRLGVRTHADNALRASYSPSPRTPGGDKTPVLLSTPSPRSARSRTSSTSSSTGPSPLRQSPRAKSKPSLTDNLLQLPRQLRQAASDFF